MNIIIEETFTRKYPKKTENLKEYYKNYYAKNKGIKKIDEVKEEQKYFNCDICKTSCKLSNKKQHLQTKKHLEYIV